ncbi:hypothetical protein CHS0354_022651 [Potamilus streckersoni]|uniref:Phospholipase A2-like central domain-containing protein n=1 Tax=Potamilus streckersoni TaxID=2493646 RepID=A0AAE0TH48_9BIVA|nr:hypothetical protein CHS0354_022651 [Potamilus streckersoni]
MKKRRYKTRHCSGKSTIRLQRNIGIRTDRFLTNYSGTKWCGIGNAARNDSDFGSSVQTDKCCKEHDGCEIYITAFQSGYGLRNYAPYTVSGCDCDEKFLECMIRVANSETVPVDDKKTARDFGSLFFNGISPKCLKIDFPLVCVEEGWLKLSCKRYRVDESKEKVWQLVQGPRFPSK